MVRRVRVGTANPFTCVNWMALMLSTLSVKRSLPPGILSSIVLPGLSSSSRVKSKKVSCRMCRTSLYKVSTPSSAVSAEHLSRWQVLAISTYREATSMDRLVLCCQVRSVVALVYCAGETLRLPLLFRPARIEKRKEASHCSKSFLRAASFFGLPKSGKMVWIVVNGVQREHTSPPVKFMI
jgi:hypothetical protein